MANLDDLGYKSISEMSPDEAIEHIRQLRLSRRVPVKSTKATKSNKKANKATAPAKLSSTQAADLLKLLEEQ